MENSKKIIEEKEEPVNNEEAKEGILSESDLGSELDDELFKLDDVGRKFVYFVLLNTEKLFTKHFLIENDNFANFFWNFFQNINTIYNKQKINFEDLPLIIAGSKCEKLEFIINEEELDEINYIFRKSSLEKKAHLLNFSTKKNINIENFYSFLTAALFEGNYVGHLSEDILELMLPYDYDTNEKLSAKYTNIAQKYPDKLIQKSKLFYQSGW